METGAPPRQGRFEWLLLAGLAVVVIALALWLADGWGRRRAAEALRSQAGSSAALDAAVLRSELEKQRALPFVLAQDPDVQATLLDPAPAKLAAMNAKLETLNKDVR